MRKIFFCCIILLMSCSNSGITINADEYGEKWPFSVNEGKLECLNGGVLFTAGGKIYALNSVASQRGYADIHPIWKNDLEMEKAFKGSENIPKIDITPILNKGLSLCK